MQNNTITKLITLRKELVDCKFLNVNYRFLSITLTINLLLNCDCELIVIIQYFFLERINFISAV